MTTGIIGTGSCVPSQIVTNEDLSKLVDTSDEWIATRTGIKERRIAISESTAELATEAAKRAIENAKIDVSEIELIIVATSSPDYAFPNTASIVQKDIGADYALCYDLSAACSGYIFALHTADAFIQAGIYRKALVIGADVMSKTLDWEDRGTCVLFGDGAGATVISAVETQNNTSFAMHSDGTKKDVLTCVERPTYNFLNKLQADNVLGYVKMEGQEVFRFAVKKVPECIQEVLEKSNTDMKDVDYFILHQANFRIIHAVAKRLGIDQEKFPCNLQKYGNTSAASIPLLLDEMNRDGRLKKGNKVVLAGFGAGLSWGAALLTW